MIKALAIVILKPKKYFEMGARSTMMSLSVEFSGRPPSEIIDDFGGRPNVTENSTVE